MDQPDRNIPVFKVRKESGNSQEKTLHRNLLLPFSSIPSSSEIDDSLLSNKDQQPRRKSKVSRGNIPTTVEEENSSESSDSESEVIVPRYVIPQKRTRNNNNG